MKGVVFTEFLKFVESEFDFLEVDHLITSTNPESKGAYTSVGTYDSRELLAMIIELAHHQNQEVSGLVRAFGGHLFRHFVEAHSATLADVSTTEQLLASVENRIHIDVRKLYPDAELPTIDFRKIDDWTSELTYASSKPFADLAEGLIESAILHFRDPISVTRQDLPPYDGTKATFSLKRSKPTIQHA